MKTLFVNLYGGPGAGKSTMAAYLFAELKNKGLNAELVTEFAKERVWAEETFSVFKAQPYVFGKQLYRMVRIDGKVDVAVTDAPLLFSTVYSTSPELTALAVSEYKKFKNLDILLERKKAYNPSGRYQTESEDKALDTIIKKNLDKHCGNYLIYPGVRESASSIITQILHKLV